ncbi:uncharacterized protein LOC107624926 [Arachis ipaensis]|uniref:uncharacterized protein LOC107624926 n=1 Tax=Arachis ipaensis TaxID=130454 RepID=UPI000A2B729B|nr:uncharacterized protein LOC107624926 [Arachis ipaensis]
MAAPFFSTPFQPYVYQSPQDAITPFQILGGEAQVVQIMLKPQEKIIAKPGSMCFMSGSIEMENSYLPENEVGIWQWLFGKNISSIVLRNSGQSDGFVGIAAPYFARILPIDLASFNGEILCQPDAFLCSVNDVKVNNTIDQRGRNLIAGAEVAGMFPIFYFLVNKYQILGVSYLASNLFCFSKYYPFYYFFFGGCEGKSQCSLCLKCSLSDNDDDDGLNIVLNDDEGVCNGLPPIARCDDVDDDCGGEGGGDGDGGLRLEDSQVDVSGGRKAVVIHVPFRLRKDFRKIHVRLVRELEKKFSGKHGTVLDFWSSNVKKLYLC